MKQHARGGTRRLVGAATAWRTRHQQFTELSNRQFATVREVATSCMQDVQSYDEQAAGIIAGVKNGVRAAGPGAFLMPEKRVGLARRVGAMRCVMAGLMMVAGTPLCSQSWDTSKLLIYDPRPMEQVVDFLQAKYGWRITYEDPLVLFPSDIVDVGPAYRRRITSPPLLAARFGRIDMKDLLPAVLNAQDDPAVLLQRAIDLHHAAGNVGEFRVLRTGDVFHVLPAKTKDEDGRVVDSTSLLDTLITIPEQERTAGEMVSAIVEAVSLGTAVTVKSNPMVFYRIDTEKLVFGALNEPARSVLLRLLDMTGKPSSSWSLLCQAGKRLCALNVYYIQVEVEGPDGAKKRVPLLR